MIVVGAELFGTPGVGYEIINASNNLAMATSVAYMFLISLAFLCMDVGFRVVVMDTAPGTTQSSLPVDIEHPREWSAHDFVDYVAQIRDELRAPTNTM